MKRCDCVSKETEVNFNALRLWHRTGLEADVLFISLFISDNGLTRTVPIVKTGSLKDSLHPCLTAAICLRAYLFSSQSRCDKSEHQSVCRDKWQHIPASDRSRISLKGSCPRGINFLLSYGKKKEKKIFKMIMEIFVHLWCEKLSEYNMCKQMWVRLCHLIKYIKDNITERLFDYNR